VANAVDTGVASTGVLTQADLDAFDSSGGVASAAASANESQLLDLGLDQSDVDAILNPGTGELHLDAEELAAVKAALNISPQATSDSAEILIVCPPSVEFPNIVLGEVAPEFEFETDGAAAPAATSTPAAQGGADGADDGQGPAVGTGESGLAEGSATSGWQVALATALAVMGLACGVVAFRRLR
jgi:hypothetical protein